MAEYWIEFGIDGWRLDVPNEIDDDDFWREFRQRVRAINPQAYIVGEVWGDATHWLRGDMWDAVMNYQVTAACLGFLGGPHLNLTLTRQPSSFRHVRQFTAAEFAGEINRLLRSCPEEVTAVQLNLLDSHDMPRFVTCCNDDQAALRMAWLFVCLLPGAPCVYYGDEVGVTGRQDPDCRKGFPWDTAKQDQKLLEWYRQCIHWRGQLKAFRHGTVSASAIQESVLLLTSDGDHSRAAVFNTGTQTVKLDLSQYAEVPGTIEVPARTGLIAGL